VTRSRRVFALDLGTTKVCCAIAELDSTGLRVIGVGGAVSRGIRKGAVIEIDRAAEAVAEAVDLAEQMSGVPVDSAVVGLAGTSITSQNSRGVVAVSAGHREVRDADVTRAVEAARAVSVPSDRKILHVLPQQFTIDGQEGVRDALGMAGTRLEVDAHIITGTNTAIQNVVKVVHKAGLDVDDLVLQILASAEAVIGAAFWKSWFPTLGQLAPARATGGAGRHLGRRQSAVEALDPRVLDRATRVGGVVMSVGRGAARAAARRGSVDPGCIEPVIRGHAGGR